MSRATLKEQVQAFTGERRLSIANPLQRYVESKSYKNLPRHAKMHWRGLLQPASGAVLGRFQVDECLLPEVRAGRGASEFKPYEHAILCHCKPLDERWESVGSENRHCDVPDRWDIYLLMRHQYAEIAFTGKTLAAVIRRSERTYRTILNLRDWESDPAGGLYRRSRVKSQLRRRLHRVPFDHEVERAHAKTALAYLGLKLPGKPNHRREDWPGLLEKLGFEIDLNKDIAPTRHRAMSGRMIREYRERYPQRHDYV
jgi:hypothetical protein